ncbi:hypothetical protein, partial [Microbacterium sp.]|uniref:hypothetical protein n=1 Tax=Microbacterium sp. TaxID=51671 RepID=UPI002B48752A
MLADRDEAEIVKAAERGQVRARESRVGHVEVSLRMASVGTSILRETSTPTPPTPSSPGYTLVREEP